MKKEQQPKTRKVGLVRGIVGPDQDNLPAWSEHTFVRSFAALVVNAGRAIYIDTDDGAAAFKAAKPSKPAN